MARVVRCSIVIAEAAAGINRVDLGGLGDAPEARGLISINEESWPQGKGSNAMRAVVSIEADNADSIRWYARRVLRLDEDHPSWLDMERQLRAVNQRPTSAP